MGADQGGWGLGKGPSRAVALPWRGVVVGEPVNSKIPVKRRGGIHGVSSAVYPGAVTMVRHGIGGNGEPRIVRVASIYALVRERPGCGWWGLRRGVAASDAAG
jgi:hypothetical protein